MLHFVDTSTFYFIILLRIISPRSHVNEITFLSLAVDRGGVLDKEVDEGEGVVILVIDGEVERCLVQGSQTATQVTILQSHYGPFRTFHTFQYVLPILPICL